MTWVMLAAWVQCGAHVFVVFWQEVLLLKRDMLTRDIHDQWHAHHPKIDGGTLGDTPVWPGTWVVDVICRVSDGTDHNIWLKSLDRTIAASPEASFIQQFSLC